jgi:wyosine [tRNA(Phe)-imidazoG37] synthetase (radical SAM superfamily)
MIRDDKWPDSSEIRSVDSIQLGRSLLISVPTGWGCPFRCIYCTAEQPRKATTRRRRYDAPGLLHCDTRLLLQVDPKATCLVLAGHSDPALHTAIGEILRKLSAQTGLPVAIKTTGALLSRGSICAALHSAAHVIVKLDAVTRQTFNRVHRPHKGVHVSRHIEGLMRFRGDYAGSFSVETVLIAGVNDDKQSVGRLLKTLRSLEPRGIVLHLHADAEEVSTTRMREAVTLVGTAMADAPLFLVDSRRFGAGDRSLSGGAMTLEESIHWARAAVLARGQGNPNSR